MTKQLPYIAIEGVGKTKEEVLDSLIAIEPLLVMMGYDKPDEENWNNRCCDKESLLHITHLSAHKNGVLLYSSAPFAYTLFKSTEINKLIKYMIDNKFIK